MPVHDWSKVDAGIFHHFHQKWITSLSDALNELLPGDYYALAEQVAIYHRSGDEVIGFIEVVSPGNKHSETAIRRFLSKLNETSLTTIAFEWLWQSLAHHD